VHRPHEEDEEQESDDNQNVGNRLGWRWGSSHAITRSPLALILSALSHFVQAATVEAHDVRLRNFGLV
jgi:hypothetical protein